MIKTKSSHGGAPKRNQRGRLGSDGYEELYVNGNAVYTEEQAKKIATDLHKGGYLAQAIHISDYNIPSSWWVVMYKNPGRK
jgi:hypothetical protein